MRTIFHEMAIQLESSYPKIENIKYIGISAFLFLRFISAAILRPKLYDLAEGFKNYLFF